MKSISLDAAVAVTGISKSTLWRRVTRGTIGRGGKDARNRVLLALEDILLLTTVELSDEDLALLSQADAGSAEAQADLGAKLYVAGAGKAALYWLAESAKQGNADAMQWLGVAYAASPAPSGARSTPRKDENLSIMWLARAAALGHPVAREQMSGLRRR